MSTIKFSGDVSAEDIAYDMGAIMGGCEEIRDILVNIRASLIAVGDIPFKSLPEELKRLVETTIRIEKRAEITRNSIDEEF